MKKKRTANLVMAAVIVLIAAAGILGVGYVQGWFDLNNGQTAALTQIRGIVHLQRDGVLFPAEDETVLRTGDVITSDPGATARINVGEGYLTLGSNARMTVGDPGADSFTTEVTEGDVFVNAYGAMNLSFDGQTVVFTDTAALLSVRSGAQSVSVFGGSVLDARAEQSIQWVNGEKSISTLSISGLNDFALNQIELAGDARTLCFSADDLAQLRADREAEQGIPEGEQTCTITIRCDTILRNMEKLDPAKAGFVPADGVILADTNVAFSEGETVFDVLDRICSENGIALEYSWSPLYGSSYIEGINHLYEFDCGSESGWVYLVNGWTPNYGCSSYTLSGGEQIVWSYSCSGNGADVGA